MLLACIANVKAAELTPEQQKAQQKLIAYLVQIDYDPAIDTSDNSVCFRRDGILYWITIEENSPMLYTMHRKGYKISTEGGYDYNLSVKAANEVNNQLRMLKLNVLQNKVDVTLPVYAVKAEDFTNVFLKNMTLLSQADSMFKMEYHKAKKAAESADTAERAREAEKEDQNNAAPSELEGYVVSMSFRLINTDGTPKTAYDAPMRKYDTRYIQPRFSFAGYGGKDPKQFTVRFKIYMPDGTLIEAQGRKYSSEATITLSKSKKPVYVEVPEFGIDNANFWKAGEYKVECEESGSVFYTTSFTLL